MIIKILSIICYDTLCPPTVGFTYCKHDSVSALFGRCGALFYLLDLQTTACSTTYELEACKGENRENLL